MEKNILLFNMNIYSFPNYGLCKPQGKKSNNLTIFLKPQEN